MDFRSAGRPDQRCAFDGYVVNPVRARRDQPVRVVCLDARCSSCTCLAMVRSTSNEGARSARTAERSALARQSCTGQTMLVATGVLSLGRRPWTRRSVQSVASVQQLVKQRARLEAVAGPARGACLGSSLSVYVRRGPDSSLVCKRRARTQRRTFTRKSRGRRLTLASS